MVKHIILWTLKEECKTNEVKSGIKNGLEGLKGKIPGLLDIRVQTECLASSNADVMLDSAFEDEASLKAYASNPLHTHVADTKVRPFTAARACMDFEI